MKGNGPTDLGVCPTGKHLTDFRQCGFAGCVDLKVWAKANGYRYRLEDSYKAENDAHIRGDGRWFVEILCRNGLIYPKGGDVLLVYAKAGVAHTLAELPDLQHHQSDGSARVFRFPSTRLDEVAAILKPRKRRTLSSDRARAISGLKTVHAQSGQTHQENDF